MTVNTAEEAFTATTALNSELDRDFKGEIKRANEKITEVRETVEAVASAVNETKSVLEAGRDQLEAIKVYFTEVVSMLAQNTLPTGEAQAIVDLAEECQTLIMVPYQPTEAMSGRCSSALSLLDEFDQTAGDVQEAATQAFDKIEELAGMISEFASE